MEYFSISNIAFEVIGYAVSWVELIGTIFGLACVWLATKPNILTWPTGIVNIICLFILFYQVQLYADMFLQIFFLTTTLYGWYYWKKEPGEKSISTINTKIKWMLLGLIFLGTFASGLLFGNLHVLFPKYFTIAADYPYVDSLVMVLSVIATILLARKKLENWYLWILVDVICVFLFCIKEIYFLAGLYFIFLFMASYGLINWKRQMEKSLNVEVLNRY